MSSWLDHQYIGSISSRLEKFSRKGEYLYNFRCPICGDSQTSQNKARGYLFAQKGGMFFKCHNCQASLTLGSLIKHLDPNLYKQYCLDRYKQGEGGRKAHKAHNFIFKSVVFESTRQNNALRSLLTPLNKMAKDSEVFDYVNSRKIPKNRYEDLYFVDDIQKFKKFVDGYDDKIMGNEPRLVLPFFDENNNLVGLSGRGLRGEKLRYVTIRIKNDSPMIFGFNKVDFKKPIKIVEGPIDSLFLNNCIGVGNANLSSCGNELISRGVLKQNITLCPDREPRNKEIVSIIDGFIKENFNVCLFPDNISGKDINEFIINGRSSQELEEIISENTHSGLKLQMEFTKWKKI